MKVIGLDPSIRAYGWAVLERSTKRGERVLRTGCIQTSLNPSKKIGKTEKNATRLRALARTLTEILMREKPSRIFAELPGGSGNAATAVALAHSFAVTVTVCALLGYDVDFISPVAMKRDVTGDPDAEKDDVANAVEKRTGWRSTATTAEVREAEADAAGLALAATLDEL